MILKIGIEKPEKSPIVPPIINNSDNLDNWSNLNNLNNFNDFKKKDWEAWKESHRPSNQTQLCHHSHLWKHVGNE